MIQPCLTTEQFFELRPELPESGQWTELIDGAAVLLEPPDLDHGTIVLNLSKQLATYFSGQPAGYACFDQGLQVSTAPDTVLFPAVSIYLTGERFAHLDDEFTCAPPQLVIEILSTPDRRERATSRLVRLMEWGVPVVWQVDSKARTVKLCHRGIEPIRLRDDDTLEDSSILSGFQMDVSDLFREPEWYR